MTHPFNTIGLAICLENAVAIPEFVKAFDDLTGSDLSRKGAPINLVIDEATGKYEADAAKFADFVREFVWERLEPGVRRELLLGSEAND